MVQLKYIGKNQPQGMIIEVSDMNAKKRLDSGDYILVEETPTKSTRRKHTMAEEITPQEGDEVVETPEEEVEGEVETEATE